MPKKIRSIKHLKKLAAKGCDCFISLQGCLKSSKHIRYDKETKQFEIIHMIDGSEQILDEHQIMDKSISNIG